MNYRGKRHLESERLAGRDHELRVLSATLDRCESGSGRLVLVGGEAGIGKTTLVEHFLTRAEQGGANILQGACYAAGSPPPYQPWRTALSSIAGSTNPFDLTPGAELPDQESFFEAVRNQLNQLARNELIVIVLEDVHWAAAESILLLRYVARTLGTSRIMILVTYRDDEIRSGIPLYDHLLHLVRESRAERLTLRTLPIEAIQTIIHDRYQLDESETEQLADLLANRTSGNPLFITEMLRSMEVSDLLTFSGNHWNLATFTDISVPFLVRQLIEQRLNQLDDQTLDVLQLASVAGYEPDPGLLLEISGIEEPELSRCIKAAIDTSFLEEASGQSHLRFRHALFQETLYTSVPLPRRQTLHRQIGDAMTDQADADPAVIADHFLRAGDNRSRTWMLAAAQRARQLYAPGAVIQHLEVVLEPSGTAATIDERREAFQLRGWAYDVLGEFDRAQRDFLAQLHLARDAEDPVAEWHALMRLAEVWSGRDYQRSGSYIEQTLQVAEESSNQLLRAHSLNRLGNWYLNREEPDRAVTCHAEALEIFQLERDQPGIGATRDLLGIASTLGGNPIDAATHYTEAIDILTALDNRLALVSSLANYSMRGITYQTDMMVPARTTLDECIADAEHARKIARAVGFRAGKIYADIRLGSCLGSRGRYQEALNVLELSIAGAHEIEHRQWLSAGYCVIGTVYLDLLDPEQARAYVEHGRHYAEQSGTIHWIRSNSGILAMAHIAQGNLELASQELRDTDSNTLPARTLAQRLVWRARIELALEQGRPDEALHLVDRVLETTPNADSSRPSVRLSMLRARALSEIGQHLEARSWLEPALEVARQQEATPWAWRIHRDLGLIYMQLGERVQASRACTEARTLVDGLSKSIEDSTLRDHFHKAALEEIPDPPPPTPLQEAQEASSGLTRRQREVAVLVAAGHSNRAIADELSVSERTVESHVTSILGRLELNSRTQLATWVVSSGLSSDSSNTT